MKLLDEIIEGAVSDTQPIGTVLRKCLVLERQVKNEKFRVWLDNELDGYDKSMSCRTTASSIQFPMDFLSASEERKLGTSL
jgi:hypothetical protein